jgi:hypothetical protein
VDSFVTRATQARVPFFIWRLRPSAIVVVSAAAVIFSGLSSSGADIDLLHVGKEAIVTRLAQQEELIRSCDCLVIYRCDSTAPDMIPLIKAHCLKTNERPTKFIYTADTAAKNSYVMHWWRKGPKERADTFASVDDMMRADAVPIRSEAFDGTIARDYTPGNTQQPPRGKMFRAEQWFARNRRDPFAYIYEDGHSRISALLERSSDVKVTKARGETSVSFTNPGDKHFCMNVVLDINGLIVRRELMSHVAKPFDPAPRLYERQSYAYQTYRDESGESIVFPSRVEIDRVHGTSADGTLIVYSHRTVELKLPHFNQPIPEEKFVVHFAKDTKVRDDVSGRGFSAGAQPKQGSRTATGGKWSVLIAVNLGVLALLVSGAAIYRWRRR